MRRKIGYVDYEDQCDNESNLDLDTYNNIEIDDSDFVADIDHCIYLVSLIDNHNNIKTEIIDLLTSLKG